MGEARAVRYPKTGLIQMTSGRREATSYSFEGFFLGAGGGRFNRLKSLGIIVRKRFLVIAKH